MFLGVVETILFDVCVLFNAFISCLEQFSIEC